MTFKERLQMEKPDRVDECFVGGCSGCPDSHSYELVSPCHGVRSGNKISKFSAGEKKCTACWNREIPGTEPINKNEREENTMPTKTKTELLEEIKNLKTQVENLAKYEQYVKGANDCYAIMQAYINAGFTRDEAFALITQIIEQFIEKRR